MLLAWLASGCTWQDDKWKNSSCELVFQYFVGHLVWGRVLLHYVQTHYMAKKVNNKKITQGGASSLFCSSPWVKGILSHYVENPPTPPPLLPGSCPKIQALFLSQLGPCFRSGNDYDIISCMVTNCAVHRWGKEFQYKPHTCREPWMLELRASLSHHVQCVTMQTYFSHPSLVIYFFSTSPISN